MIKTAYSPSLKAHLSEDAGKRVRHIRHSQRYWLSEVNSPRLAANQYLHDMADVLQLPREQLAGVNKKAQHLFAHQQGVEYQLREEKHLFDATTVAYAQTYLNVPVWRRGISVKVKPAPTRIIGVMENSEDDLDGTLPPEQDIERYRTLFLSALPAAAGALRGEESRADETARFIRKLLGVSTRAAARREDRAGLLSGKFFVYKYDPMRRYGGKPAPPDRKPKAAPSLEDGDEPFLPLRPVAPSIRRGRAYLVAELIVRFDLPGLGELVWLALAEVETDSILYLELMTCGVNGLVFRRDPQVSSGILSVTSDDDNTALENHDSSEVLHALDPPSNGTQHLSGTFVVIQNEEFPDIDPPTKATGVDFDFQPRTDAFAAVNSYYHQTEIFRTMEDLGFVIADYFDSTTFPIPVDHRGQVYSVDGIEINAHWSPNGSGGTDHLCFCLCDLSNTDEPLGRAVDPWVHWHEMGGHGTLGDHVGIGNFGFAHSAGDGLAALQMDPESALRAMPERFRYAPFRPITTVERRFDRPVPEWAWGSPVVTDPNTGYLVSGDDGQYGSEQILATCHFRIYRSIGGDHENLGRRQFASRLMTYLILRSIGELDSGTNPNDAELWCEHLQLMDEDPWTSEGLSGGAYNKVIRWSFEQQGNYDGDPPPVDVYIDDGRAGEYPFQANHWSNMSVWNRNLADGIFGHQNAVAGTNYMYVKVKNRGTSAAANVVVKGFHCLPGAGLTWPVDFTEMSPAAGLSKPSIGPNSSDEVTFGPFEWVPNENAYGHDCTLMIASTDGDPSNIDKFTPTETVAEWRLVPNDNNIGQRNVTIEPGGGGAEALSEAMDGAVFVARNSFNRPASMALSVELPRLLADKGWAIDLGTDAAFSLAAGARRQLSLKLVKGADFTPDEIRNLVDRDINVHLYADGMVLGGMTYRLDPDLRARTGGSRPKGDDCRQAVKALLGCLDVSAGGKVKSVRVKKVSLDIEFGGRHGCD